MGNIFSFLGKKFVPIVGVGLLTTLTLGTSAMGILKVANGFEPVKPKVAELQKVDAGSEETVKTGTNNGSTLGVSSQKTSQSASSTNTSNKSNTSTQAIASSPSPVGNTGSSAAANTANRCVITLFGKQYDVTDLQNTHSGGNIFNCGTDMTAVYQGQHGTDTSRMQKYLITNASGNQAGNGQTNTGTSLNAGGNVGITGSTSTSLGRNSDDDEEDFEHSGEDNEGVQRLEDNDEYED